MPKLKGKGRGECIATKWALFTSCAVIIIKGRSIKHPIYTNSCILLQMDCI